MDLELTQSEGRWPTSSLAPVEACFALRWFAVTVKPQHELAVAQGLTQKQIESFLPTYCERRRWSDRLKTLEVALFPGYVFARFDALARVPVLRTAGVRKIVGFGNELCPIPDSEIAALQTIIRSGRPVGPHPFLRVGQKVRINRGPLSGVEGVLLRIKTDAWRLVVSVELLQRSVAVELERDCIG